MARSLSDNPMLNILILEDDPRRVEVFESKLGDKHKLTCVDTAQAAIELLEKEKYDVVFLDHDLGGETFVDPHDPNTGSEVVRWMVTPDNLCHIKGQVIIIHSMNFPAAQSMKASLEDARFSVEHSPQVNWKQLGTWEFEVYYIPFIKLLSNYLDDPSFLS